MNLHYEFNKFYKDVFNGKNINREASEISFFAGGWNTFLYFYKLSNDCKTEAEFQRKIKDLRNQFKAHQKRAELKEGDPDANKN